MAQTSIINSANDYYLRDLLNPDSLLKYVIPKYQREYSWRKPQWAALYDDIMGESGSKPHFLGTVIAISGDDAGEQCTPTAGAGRWTTAYDQFVDSSCRLIPGDGGQARTVHCG